MKSISLDKKTCKELLKPALQVEEYDFFKNNEELYKQIWKQQNHEFWIKFVTATRNVVACKGKEAYNVDSSDPIFIEFLKKLVGKSFPSLCQLIKSVGASIKPREQPRGFLPQKCDSSESGSDDELAYVGLEKKTSSFPKSLVEQRSYVESKCVAGFLRLHALWSKAAEGCKVEWTFPDSWIHQTSSVQPYEEFLKARWGDSLLTKLGCQEGQVGWWNVDKLKKRVPEPTRPQPRVAAPPPKPKKPVPKTIALAKTMEKMGNVKLNKNPTKPDISKHSKSYQERLQELKSEKSDEKNLFNSKRIQQWLPKEESRMKYINLPESSTIKDFNFFMSLIKFRSGYDFKWASFERLIPPLLARKFHVVDPLALYEADKEQHYLGVGTWFTLWNESHGVQMTRYIQKLFEQCKEIDQIPVVFIFNMGFSVWAEEIGNVVKTLSQAIHLFSTPGIADCISSPEQFLLEPCVLIQLPWYPVVLYQWLACALIQIMRFESESMELRYWPMSRGAVEECARELLWLVARTKERLLLGLYMLAQLQQCGKVERALLLDTVVLPSVPVLRLLCSGEAAKILHNLKALAFSQPFTLGDAVTLPEKVYSIQESLQEFYVQHHWHAQYWLNDDHGDPFVSQSKVNVEVVSRHIKRQKMPAANKNAPQIGSKINKEEQTMHALWTSLNFENDVLGDVLKSIANPRRIIKILISLGYFRKSDEQELCSHILDNQASRSPLISCVTFSEIFAVSTFPLTGIDKNQTVFGWLVRLSGEVLERAMLARLTAACAVLLGRSPALPRPLEQVAAVEPHLLLEQVRAVQAQATSLDREWLLDQLPATWREPVAVQQQGDEGLTEIAKSLGVRVGRIVAGLATHSLQVDPTSPFPMWQMVQYVVPGFIASLLEVAQREITERVRPRVIHLVRFLHCMVQHYEQSFLLWREGKTRPKKVKNAPLTHDVSWVEECMPTLPTASLFMEKASQLMYACVGLGSEFEGIPGFDAFLDGILYMTHLEDHSEGFASLQNIYYRAHLCLAFDVFHDLYRICKRAWCMPEPGSPLRAGPVLSAVYLASEAMEEMHPQLTLQALHNPLLATSRAHQLLNLDGPVANLKNWRYTMLALVAQSEQLVPMDENLTLDNIERFAQDSQNVLLEVWKLFVQIRKNIQRWQGASIPVPSEDGDAPRIKALMQKFMRGDIKAVEKELGLVQYYGEGAGTTCYAMIPTFSGQRHRPRVSDEEEQETQQHISRKKPIIKGRYCRNCRLVEQTPNSLIVCPECVEHKYPDTNYFCSSYCLHAWWKTEHMAEHLEFDLGLIDF